LLSLTPLILHYRHYFLAIAITIDANTGYHHATMSIASRSRHDGIPITETLTIRRIADVTATDGANTDITLSSIILRPPLSVLFHFSLAAIAIATLPLPMFSGH
jgi:hypothetical protein